jgi:hypothetical protein
MGVGSGGVANFVYTTNAVAKGVAAVINAGRGVVANLFDPRWELFSSAEQGMWYDLNDLSTLFTDSAGTTPATWGDPIGLLLDKHESDRRGVVNRIAHSEPTSAAQLLTATNVTFQTSNTELGNGSNVLLADATVNRNIAYTTINSYQGSVISLSFVVKVGAGVLPNTGAGNYRDFTITIDGSDVINYASITYDDLGGGVYRAKLSRTMSSTAIRFDIRKYGGLNTNTPVIVSMVQFEVSPAPTAYQANGASVGGPGNHRIQATAGSRPILGRMPKVGVRNLLRRTQEFDNAYWTKLDATITENQIIAPDGTLTADKLVENTANAAHSVRSTAVSSTSGTKNVSAFIKAGERTFAFLRVTDLVTGGAERRINLSTGVVDSVNVDPAGSWTSISVSSKNIGNGWYRIDVTATQGGGTTIALAISVGNASGEKTYTGDGTSGVFIWGAQLELGSTATNYQHVIDSLGFNVTESGQPSCGYLSYNGSNQWMQTAAAVNFSATDEMSVFAGVRKVSNAAAGVVVELSVNRNINNGAFSILAPTGALSGGSYASRGTLDAQAVSFDLVPPIFTVLTGLSEISADVCNFRSNAVQIATSATDQGTGNFGNYVTYFGARAGTSFYFNGLEFSSIIRGALTSGTLLTRTEQYVARQTPTVNL